MCGSSRDPIVRRCYSEYSKIFPYDGCWLLLTYSACLVLHLQKRILLPVSDDGGKIVNEFCDNYVAYCKWY